MINKPSLLPPEAEDRVRKLAASGDLSYSDAWHRVFDEWQRRSVPQGHVPGLAAGKLTVDVASLPFRLKLPSLAELVQRPYLADPHVSLASLEEALAGKDDYRPLAAYLSVRAALAYRDSSALSAYVEDEGGENFQHFENLATAAYGYTRAGHAFLAFRGTRTGSIDDWLTDLSFFPLLWPLPLRHLGFSCAWRGIRFELFEWVRKLPEDSRQLVLTGHSLGGALAVMAAFDLARLFSVRWVITFGQPRVGLLSFSQFYDTRPCGPEEPDTTLHAVTRRYIHETDVISRLPPPLLYCHVGNRWLLDASGNCNQGRSKKMFSRLEESYVDLKFKLMTFPQKVAAKQESRLISWDDALKNRSVQTPPPAERKEPVPRIESTPPRAQVVSPRVEKWEWYLSGITRLLTWIVHAPVQAFSLVGIFLGVVTAWSYKRDAESHFKDKYLEAFHKAHPQFVRPGDLKYCQDTKK